MSALDAEKIRAAQATAMRNAITHARENWPMLLDAYAHQAKMERAKFLAYTREGFTEQQALHLCRCA